MNCIFVAAARPCGHLSGRSSAHARRSAGRAFSTNDPFSAPASENNMTLTLLARMAISQLKPAVPKHLAHQRTLDLAGDLLANLGSELQLGIAISG